MARKRRNMQSDVFRENPVHGGKEMRHEGEEYGQIADLQTVRGPEAERYPKRESNLSKQSAQDAEKESTSCARKGNENMEEEKSGI
jgi:hypothetical protein